MNSSDILIQLRVTIDEIDRPWAAFTGLVTLRPSLYVQGEEIYALRTTPGLDELTSVVLHPDTIPKARSAAFALTGRRFSDPELAAMLYWLLAHAKRDK